MRRVPSYIHSTDIISQILVLNIVNMLYSFDQSLLEKKAL